MPTHPWRLLAVVVTFYLVSALILVAITNYL